MLGKFSRVVGAEDAFTLRDSRSVPGGSRRDTRQPHCKGLEKLVLNPASHSQRCDKHLGPIKIRARIRNPASHRYAALLRQIQHRRGGAASADRETRFGDFRLNGRQDLVAEPDDGVDVRAVIHDPRKDDRCRLLRVASGPKVVEIDAVADQSYRDSGDQPLEITPFEIGVDQRVRESTCDTPLIGEEPLLFDCVDPLQWNSRPLRVLPPFQRVEVAELHDPWHLRKVLGELRHIAAVDDDQVRTQFVKFSPDRGVQLRLVEGRHRERFSTEQRLERPQLDRQRIYRSSSNACHILPKAGDVVEVLRPVAETEDMHLVPGREVTDLVEGGDLVAAVRRERDTPTDKENSHR